MRNWLKKNILKSFFIFLFLFNIAGCVTVKESTERPKSNPIGTEADWIRNGESFEFEGELLYPQDEYEVLLDSEDFRVGNYQGVNFFIEKIDVRPYNHLYTKFDRNKYRIFTKETQ